MRRGGVLLGTWHPSGLQLVGKYGWVNGDKVFPIPTTRAAIARKAGEFVMRYGVIGSNGADPVQDDIFPTFHTAPGNSVNTSRFVSMRDMARIELI
jgi:hypothetical protein